MCGCSAQSIDVNALPLAFLVEGTRTTANGWCTETLLSALEWTSGRSCRVLPVMARSHTCRLQAWNNGTQLGEGDISLRHGIQAFE